MTPVGARTASVAELKWEQHSGHCRADSPTNKPSTAQVPTVILHTNQLVDRLVHMSRITTVGAFEAKTQLNRLLKRVSNGETIRITRRGVPVAKLVPDDVSEKPEPSQLVQEIRQLRKGATLGKITIRELINEGRRY